uniref:Ig-like domain-containing protein n=1 Tax=Arion vulgaris TaxID=1028688 RepID=A0A0B7AWF7_9EUPU
MESMKKRETLHRTYLQRTGLCLAHHLFILAVCLLLHTEAVRSQTPLQEKDIEITHKIDTDAVLTCVVKDLGTRRIMWNKLSDPYPISVGKTRFNPRKNYKIDATDNRSVLTIKNIKLEDAGEYQCRVTGQVYQAEILTLNIQGVTDNTYLLKSETEILAVIGSTAVLPCQVQNIQNNLVLWKNSKNDVLTLGRKKYNGDNRLAIQHITSTEWSLRIKNIRESDFGLYTCMINSQPILTRTVQLKNSLPAQLAPLLIHDNSFRKRVDAVSGETVSLTCNFKASPPAKVSWYRRKTENGKTIKQELGKGNTFTIRSVISEQSGLYFCVGDNGLKPAGRGKIQLNILAPPTAAPVLETTTLHAVDQIGPHMYADKKRIGQQRGLNFKIECTAIGLPRPVISWSRHEKTLSNNYKYKITDENSKHDQVHSVLLVRSAVDGDFGDYRCQGRNFLGQQYITFEVYVIN